MKIAVVGGGPGGLFFGILMKQAFEQADITIYERNRPDDTFGWGVVFSDETLGNIEAADPVSFANIRKSFAYWDDIETYVGGECVRSTGHGFCGLSRMRLLQILQERCRELQVPIRFETEIASAADVADADLILAADGINSALREQNAAAFRPHLDWRECRFSWLGTDKRLEAFTFIFRENEHGLFHVHAYPFEEDRSTFIVECHEDTWQKAGFDRSDEAATIAYFEELFADHLDGHRLLANRSIWRQFPTVTNERWHHGKIVLIGDAAHTAHFSIGSGTKLAMEDAIALVKAFQDHGTKDVSAVLEAYEDARRIEVLKTQRAAQTSLEWFESSRRYLEQPPLQFTFNLMCRSKRITYDNLAVRDPDLVARVTEWFAEENGCPREADGRPAPPMFAPYRLRELELSNRVVVSPMCQYSSEDGAPSDWHLVHLGSRGIGGAGLVIAEMTNVTREGRITHGCAGIYSDDHVAGWRRVVEFVHGNSPSKIGLQLGHAGRKASCSLPWEGDAPLKGDSAWTPIGPSALPFDEGWPTPRAIDRGEMDALIEAYVAATRRAQAAGFDLLELHMAHGYLLSSFLTPLANQRDDAYGGSLENRMRFPLEVFDAVRAAWPEAKPLSVRVSATDWLDDDGGQTIEDTIVLANELKRRGCDVIDVSTAGNSPRSRPDYGRMYQVPFAERIRYEVEIAVMAVGAILGADHANTVLAAGRTDLVAMARPHLRDPYLTLHAANRYELESPWWPNQYLAGRRAPKSES